jgi:hypothetical protein
MSVFCDDISRERAYFSSYNHGLSEISLALSVFEWGDALDASGRELRCSARNLTNGELDEDYRLRIIFAPYNIDTRGEFEDFESLCNYYSIPAAAIVERQNDVSHSFRAMPTHSSGDVKMSWCHCLSKDVQFQPTGGSLFPDRGTRKESQAVGYVRRSSAGRPAGPMSWHASDYFLHVVPGEGDSRSVKSATLLCFGASDTLVARFQTLLGDTTWRQALQEPYLLFDIIYDELYNNVDGLAWNLANTFRDMELSTLDHANGTDTRRTESGPTIEFAALHNMSKHCFHMNEVVDGAILALSNLVDHLESLSPSSGGTTSSIVVSALKYRIMLMRSTQLRLRSLEKRMTNIISLSFNLVTQKDSRVMQNDSYAMKTIAVLTLVFLPAAGIGTVFSMPFFNVDFQNHSTNTLEVARSFWIFWIITVPITAALFFGWWWWSLHRAKNRGVDRKGASESKPSHPISVSHEKEGMSRDHWDNV